MIKFRSNLVIEEINDVSKSIYPIVSSFGTPSRITGIGKYRKNLISVYVKIILGEKNFFQIQTTLFPWGFHGKFKYQIAFKTRLKRFSVFENQSAKK